MLCDVLELAAKTKLDIRSHFNLSQKCCLQIGAVHHPIGRAGAEGRGFAKRQAADLAAGACAHDVDGVRHHRAPGKARLEPEIDQDAAGIGRELQAGAGFFQLLGLLQHDDAEAFFGERQGGRQSPDAGTSHEDGARYGHGWIRRPCPSARTLAGGLRRPSGRRQNGIAWSNRGR